MTEQTKTRIPAPLYAAAGAGDLAYRQLRKLPEVVGELSGRALASGFELRERAVASFRVAETTATVLRDKAAATDLDRLRDTARRNTTVFAQAAQERATAVYTALVAHGERVVGTGVVQAADVVNADLETTEAPAVATATPADVAEVVEEKAEKAGDKAEKPAAKAPAAKTTRPAKRTRAAAK